MSGSSWSDQNPTGLTGASGPMPCFEGVNSEIVCLLAGPNDVLVSTDGGADWAAQSIGGSVPDTPTAFSCPATNLCLGGTQGGAVISSTTFTDGTSGIWSAPVPVAGGASPVQISAQSCAFASLCLASDGIGRILTSANPAGGASTWTSGIADPGQNITTLDCPSLSLCVATGQDLTGNFGNKVLVSANPAGGAGTWSSGSPISADEEPIENLACPSASLCVAVNTNGDVMSTTQPTDTASWTQPQQIVNAEAIYRLQCPSTTLCVATDSDGGVASSTNPGAGGSSWLARQTIDTTDSDLEGLQCPSPSLCVAVDSEGNVLASTDPGTASTWSTPTSIDPIGLDDLQCPSTSLCVAVDFNGDVLTSTNPAAGAGSWSKPVSIDPSPIRALLCFESGQCGAVDETGAVVYSTDPAGGASEWSAPTKIDSAGATTSGGAACPTLTLCVLSDSLGNVIVGTVPSANPSTPPGSSTPTSPSNTPSVTAGSPVVKGQGAGFSGSVDPNGLASTAHFEYGLDPEYTGGGPIVYTNVTPTVSVGSGSAAVPVNQSVSGLVPNARYHVRLVASNSAGTATGPDQAFMTAKLPNPPSPVLGQDENVVPVSGRVFIKFPAGKDPHLAGVVKGQGFIPLTQARQVPVGSQVDARRGTLDLVVATTKKRRSSTARLAGGVFSLAQQRTGPLKGLATFSLLENAFPGAPSYSSCTIKKTGKSVLAGVAKLNPKVLQTLTASDNNGKFRTKGRYSAATVRGTFWETEDRCDGTLTIVKRGSVNVQDFKTRKTIIVRAGHSFLAAAATSPKPTKKKKRK